MNKSEVAAPRADLVTVNTATDMQTAGEITLATPKLLPMASELRAQVHALGGAITRENITYLARSGPGAAYAARNRRGASPARYNAASFGIELQPTQVATFLAWLDANGHILYQQIDSQRITPAPIPTTTEATATPTATDVATPPPVRLSVFVMERSPQAEFDEAGFTINLHANVLRLDALGSGAGGTRGGAGMGLRFDNTTVDVTGYPATDDRGAAVMATLGGIFYGRSTGGGARTTMNPYLGVRTGYAYDEGSYWAIAAELGVELFKKRGVLIAVGVAPTGLIGRSSTLAVEANGTMGVAF